MKTLGIGVDIIDNFRIKKSLKNKNFIDRVFSTIEINKSKKINNKNAFFSKRFAAKEAFSKALGTGFSKGLNFQDISIINDKHGKPSIKINNKLKNIALIKQGRLSVMPLKKSEWNEILKISE